MKDDKTGALSLPRQLQADIWPRLDARLSGFFADNQTEVTYVDLREGDRLHYDLEGGKLTLVFSGDAVTVSGVDEKAAAGTAHKWAKLRTPE